MADRLWQQAAACSGRSHLFDLPIRGDARAALDVCAGCSVFAECRAYAADYTWVSIVIAGQVFREKPGRLRI